LAFLVAILTFWPGHARAGGEDFRLTIMHVNDTHGHIAPIVTSIYYEGRKIYLDIGGFPRLATKVTAVRKGSQHSLLLHGGDVFQGTLYFSLYGGMADVALMNLTGFDAMVVGNHEFDKGSDVLARFIKTAQFPVLGSNIDTSRDTRLHGLLAPLVIREFDGRKVAIVGLAPPETPSISLPDNSLIFSDPSRKAQDIINALESQGINMIIVLSHIGFDGDMMLAKAVDGIDVIVGGHSHTLLGDIDGLAMPSKGPYPTEVRTPSGQRTFVVQAWEWLKVLGVLDVIFDENGIVTECAGNPVIISGDTFWAINHGGDKIALQRRERDALQRFIASNPGIEIVPEDQSVVNKLTFFDRAIGTLKSEVIATVTQNLPHFRLPGKTPKGTGHIVSKASYVAPLVAESMLWKARSAGYPVQIVIQNAGGIRTDISKGTLTAFQVYEVLPFGNSLYLLQLSGKEILATLEAGASRSGGAFPYVAGMRYTADMNRRAGQRITRVEITPPYGLPVALEEKTNYLVGTNSYLASGGDGYKIFKKVSSYRYDTGFVDAEIFIEYAKHLAVLHRPVDMGVTFVHYTPSSDNTTQRVR